MRREFELLRPELVIPVGKLAIAAFAPEAAALSDVVGTRCAASCSATRAT